MNYIYEVIKFNDVLPSNIFIHKIDLVQSHWHESIEILFVTKGRVNLLVEGKEYILKEDDFIIINSKEIHSIKSNEDNLVIAVQINLNKFNNLYKDIDKINFQCKSFECSDTKTLKLIRKILSQIIYENSKQSNGYYIKINTLLGQLIYILINRFKSSENVVVKKNSYKYLERLNRIILYIENNYYTDISLSQIADREHLSPQYFSKFFEKYIGVNFLTYLNSVRLEHAVKDLINTDYNIVDIALNNGFSNVKSFTSIFKKKYNQTPSEYRKSLNENKINKVNISNNEISYLELNNEKHIDYILKYLDKENNEDNDILEISNKIEISKHIDLNKKIGKLNHTWKNILTIGKAKEGLMSQVQNHLIEIQRKIGFKYVRFHGIFDDTMMVYDEDINGNVIFNFTYVNQLFDFFIEIGLKPFIELGFMPSKLALNKDKKVFYINSIISEPKDIKLWNLLIDKFIRNCINRYGINEVKSWYFEIWNEPDFEEIFGFSKSDYYNEFFKETYKTIKHIDEEFKIGGPSILGSTIRNTKWLENYLDYCQNNKCIPDFITFHSYPIEHKKINDKKTEYIDLDMLYLDKDENYLANLIEKLKKTLSKYKLGKIEIYLTEWNSTASHRDLTNDTLYKASYITKNILDNIDLIDGFGYWASTDLLEESMIDNKTFHGGLGIITNNGIKKSAFYAYELMSKLGNELIESGDNYFVTKQGDTYQVILYNYCHFNDRYINSNICNTNNLNIYEVFDNKEISIKLSINNFREGNYLFKEYKITRKHGCSFDTWIELGGVSSIDGEDKEYINAKSTPEIKKHNIFIESSYYISQNLKPHEVKMYIIKPIY